MKSLYARGSKGNLYKITKDGDNYTCECKSFYYNRHTCKHIEKLKKEKSNKMSKTSSKEKETSSVPGVVFGVVVYAAFIVIAAHAVVGGI